MNGFGNGDDYDDHNDDQHDDSSQDDSAHNGGSDQSSIFDDMSVAIEGAGPYLDSDGNEDAVGDDSGGESDDTAYGDQDGPSGDGDGWSEDQDGPSYSDDADDFERLDGDYTNEGDSTNGHENDQDGFSHEEEEQMILDYLNTGQGHGNPDFFNEPPSEELPDKEQ